MRAKKQGNQITFVQNYEPKKEKKEVSFDRNVMCQELNVVIKDLEHAINIICKTNHDFVFEFVFNTINYSIQAMPTLFSKLEKLLGATQKDEKVVSDYNELMNFLKDEFSIVKEEEGYNNDFLKKLNKTLKVVNKLRKNFN